MKGAGWGGKCLLVIPLCAIAEGQGTVRFLQAGGQKQMNQVFRAAKTPSRFLFFFFFNETKDRYVCRDKTWAGAEYSAPSKLLQEFSKNTDSICVYFLAVGKKNEPNVLCNPEQLGRDTLTEPDRYSILIRSSILNFRKILCHDR